MQPLRQSTVTEVDIGPAVAVGDGFTPVTTLTIASADEKHIIKHNGTTSAVLAGTLAAYTIAVDGHYHLDLSTGETDTLGRLTIVIQDDSLILPIRHEFEVLPANVFDSIYGSDRLQVDVVEWLNTAVTAAVAGRPDVNTTAIKSNSAAATTLAEWLKKGVSFQADSGSVTTIVDASLTEADNSWNGYGVVFTGGANSGYFAIATDFDAASDTLTFAPAVPTGVTTENYTLVPGLGFASVEAWLRSPPNALVGGAVDAAGDWNVGKTGYTAGPTAASITTAAFAAGAINAAALATNMLTAIKINADAITAAKVAPDVHAEGADVVWDEDVVAAHGGASAAGLLLRVLGALISTRTNNATLNALLGVADSAANDVPNQILTGETMAELIQGIPDTTPTLAKAMMLHYMTARNKLNVGTPIKEVFNDAGTRIATKALTDVADVYSEAKMISGV